MGQTEYKIFIVLATIILLVFIGGIIVFIFQYHKRKLLHEREKAILNEQHTQELLTAQIEIQEQTMQDIGRDIHDNIGQRLTLASIYANQLSHDKSYPQINDRVSEIGKLISESLADLRSLSKSLTILNTDAEEMMDMVSYECDRVNALNLCKVSCKINSTEFKISNTVKNFILRIIQEFLQNSLKHSACKEIQLVFKYTANGLSIDAFDDGKGFNMNDHLANEHKGIGLTNMKKRAELIGAEFAFESIVHKGTRLHLLIPTDKLYA